MLRPINNTFRETVSLDGFWAFAAARDQGAETSDWPEGIPPQHELAVPGSWNEQVGELYHFFGFGWYERMIHVPKGWGGQRIFLRIGSVNQDAKVWLDGRVVGEHFGGHLPVDLELSEHVTPGSAHRLTIRVDGHLRQRTLPSGHARREEDRLGFQSTKPDVPFDFFPYAGIHRSVELYSTPQARIDQIKVDTDFEGSEGIFKLWARMNRSGDEQDRSGKLRVVIEDTTVEASACGREGSLEVRVPDVRLWNVGAPELYEICVEWLEDDTVIDRYTVTTGVRTIRVDREKVYINGHPIWLTGFGKHEDFPVNARGLNQSLIVKDFDLLKWTNSNSFRTSHYPYAEDWYDYADRHGILVIGETPFVSLAERLFDDELEQRACEVIEEMMVRDWNHPSLVLWSVANEPFLRSDRGTQFFEAMADAARRLDTTRPVGYVAHETPELNAAAQHFDWIGVNKYFGWYEGVGEIDGTLETFENLLKGFHDAYQIPILLSEFGADAIQGCTNQVPLIFTENYQCEIVEKQYRVAARLPFIFGCHVWNFAEFATGQQLNRAFNNRKGAFTRDRQPKMLAFKLKELFAKSREEIVSEPMPESQLAGGLRR